MAVAHLTQVAPFPWRRFLRGAELAAVGRVVLAEFTAIQRIVALYAITPMATLKAWHAFHLVDETAPYLSRRFATAHFRFHENILAGVARPAERWKRGVSLVDSEMRDAIGRLYVERYFSRQTKAHIDDMVTQIRLALRERLERVGWMSHKTKEKAVNKLSHLTVKSGYPKEWRDYSKLEIKAGELLGSIQIARTFDWARRVARLDSQVDRNEWDTTPQTINSNYSSNLNEVVLPAGQMQAPYFHPAADRAVNYGGIGTIIGHELIHALDDDGRKYNAEGALSNWWTDADAREFNVRTANLSRQYDSFEPLRGMHVNGRMTIDESIADLGGVLVALDAYRRSLAGSSAPVVDGLTGDQRFFLSYAQSFRAKKTDQSTRLQLASDPHAPERYRVNGTVRNIGPWYQSFNVRESDKLFLPTDRRIQIW
jgi:putative endopeptidase